MACVIKDENKFYPHTTVLNNMHSMVNKQNTKHLKEWMKT